MKTFLITYDLKEGQDYEPLYKAIKGLTDNSWHGMQNVWFIKGNDTLECSDIVTELMKHVYSNDKLFVCKLTDWWSAGLRQDGVDWLKN